MKSSIFKYIFVIFVIVLIVITCVTFLNQEKDEEEKKDLGYQKSATLIVVKDNDKLSVAKLTSN